VDVNKQFTIAYNSQQNGSAERLIPIREERIWSKYIPWRHDIACYHASTECIWTRFFLHELGLLPKGPTLLNCDNEAAIKIASFHMINPRSKHFDTKFHYLREQVHKGVINLGYIPGKENIADIWTKALGKSKFIYFRSQLGVNPAAVQNVSEEMKIK
jgi:hypothetical protein